MSTRQRPVGYRLKLPIILSVFLSAGSGIAYEILAATTLTDLLGSSVYHFSLVIGIYLAALGIGGWLSSRISAALFTRLILIELVLALVGGSLAFLIIGSERLVFNLFSAVVGPLGSKTLFMSFSLLLVLMIGVLVGLELPLFSRALAAGEDLKGALGKAFFWDYCGGLVTAVSLPIFFLPSLGLLRTTFLMGLLNACAALILIIAAGVRQKFSALIKIGFAAALAVNIGGVLTAHRWELFFEEERYAISGKGTEPQRVLVLRRSPYQKIVLTRSPTGVLRLYLNGQDQFASGAPERLYHESLVHPAMATAEQHDQILVLGGGDGLALREILKYPDVRKVTLVDIDEEVVELAKGLEVMRALNHASFFEPRVEVVIDDAFMFVKHFQGTRHYDVIIIDFPDPTEESLARLYSKEFYAMVRRRLHPQGVVAIQSSYFLSFYHRTIFTTVKAAGFSSVLAYHPQGAFDAVTLASMRTDLLSAFEGMVVPVPTSVMRARNDVARLIVHGRAPPYRWIGVRANTLFFPVILNSPDRFSLWRHYLKPRIKRWFRRHPGATTPPSPHGHLVT